MLYAYVRSNNVIDIYDNTVADSVQFEKIKFSFPESWKDYEKTAVFTNGETVINIVLTTDECYIPYEVIKAPSFTISVFGIKGDSVATATEALVNVLESGYKEGTAPSEPTPTEYQQIINLTNETKEIAQSVRDDADNGAFNGVDGRDGADGKNGINGADGIGITKSKIINGELILTYSNDETDNVGQVVGTNGKDGLNGRDGTDGVPGENGITPHIGENGNWYIGELDTQKPSQGEIGPRGYSGLVPKEDVAYRVTVPIPIKANTMNVIERLQGSATISLDTATEVEGYDNEYDFQITLNENVYMVALPEIHWGLGIAPTFSANTTTLCRLYYVGETLCGEWVTV